MSVQPFLIALQFLTIFPVTLKTPVNNTDIGNSLLYYPLIGVLISLPLFGLIVLLQSQVVYVTAIIVLIAWVVISGGLHLDGLADSADAWLGGLASRERTLQIMKDPTSGPLAVISLVLLLLLKLVMLGVLIQQEDYLAIVWAIILARSAMPLLLLTTPYARNNGLAAILKQYQPHSQTRWLLLVIAVFTALFTGLLTLLFVLTVFLLLRYLMERRLAGFTGDTAGAMIEIIEASLLTFFVLTIGII